MRTKVGFEMNRVYLEIEGEEIVRKEDYRHKILATNDICSLILPKTKEIDGEKITFYDITDRESLFNCLIKRIADKDEIINLFEELYRMSETLKDYLIDESNILLFPELIYKNLRTGKYEFICLPVTEEAQNRHEGMKELLQFLMTRLDNNDEKLVDTIFNLYNISETSRIKVSVIYETLLEAYKSDEIVELESESEIEDDDDEKDSYGIYIPSIQEIGAYGMCLAGIIIIGINVYRALLLM